MLFFRKIRSPFFLLLLSFVTLVSRGIGDSLSAMRRPRSFRVLLPLGDDASNGSVLFTRWRFITGRRSGWPGRSRWPMMVQRGRRPPRRRRRLCPVRRVISLLAAGWWRRCSVLLFLQQLPELLDGFVQGPQLRQQRKVKLPQTELCKYENNYCNTDKWESLRDK